MKKGQGSVTTGVFFISIAVLTLEVLATLLPWAIGANGFAAVLGASIALPGAMIFGYQAVLLTGLCFYLIAAITFPKGRKS